MDPLATYDDLSARDIPSTSRTDADLASASAAVREAAGSPISQVTATARALGGCGQWLHLPGPVVAVTAVTIDDETVTDSTTFPHALFRRCGWGDVGSVVTVTGTFGLAVVPADIVSLVCDMVAMASAGDLVDPRVSQESIDDYRVTYRDDAGVSVFELPKRTRDALYARFSGGVAVTW